jgi:hypothetical protein
MAQYYNYLPQNVYSEEYYKKKFQDHAALSEHYARQKMVNASNSQAYYKYAELEYFHKSRALHYKAYFMAQPTMDSLEY